MLARLVPILQGVVNYGNPVRIVYKRWTASPGEDILIVDRRTGVSVEAAASSYHMFGETWYSHDYDVPGCAMRPGDVVLDIGAHQGFFSCYAAAKGATVHAFEPSPDSYRRLTSNIRRNGFEGRVHCAPKAVAATTGTATLRRFDYLGGGSDTIVPSHVPEMVPTSKVTVDTIAIDAVVNGLTDRVRLCKLDCEGAEFDIIRSITQPSRIDAFALEFHPQAYPLAELVTAITAWGTHQVSFARNSYILYAVSDECLLEHAASAY